MPVTRQQPSIRRVPQASSKLQLCLARAHDTLRACVATSAERAISPVGGLVKDCERMERRHSQCGEAVLP